MYMCVYVCICVYVCTYVYIYMYIYVVCIYIRAGCVYIYMVAVHVQIELNSNIEPFLPNSVSFFFLGHGVNPRYPKNGIVLSAQFVERCNLFVGFMGHGFCLNMEDTTKWPW